MTPDANMKCPRDCGGRLEETDLQEYECSRCGRRIRQVVVENLDAFKRVAERGGPASEIAAAALEGVQHGE